MNELLPEPTWGNFSTELIFTKPFSPVVVVLLLLVGREVARLAFPALPVKNLLVSEIYFSHVAAAQYRVVGQWHFSILCMHDVLLLHNVEVAFLSLCF